MFLLKIMIGGRDGKHASVRNTSLALFVKLCLPSQLSKLSKPVFHPNAALSQWSFLFLLVCTSTCMFSYFFVREKVSYSYIISFFEKSSNLDSMKLRPTHVCLWKSTQTVLHSKYPFCSKDANQTGNTSSLLVHCLKQYLAINCSNGWTKNCIYECQGNRKQ